ncbi:MAG: hypothetical protein GY719_03760, partial [bacterium]|nr:hypothetical protein [bacterium]
HFAKGSDRQIIDPIESIISETFNLANRISHARVMSSLVDYAEMHPGSGWLVELEPTRMKKVTLAFGEIRRQLKKAIQEDGKPLDADTVLDWVDPDAVLEIWRKQEKPPGMENITYYMKDGEPQWVRLDPQLYRAVKGMDAEWVHKFVRIAGAPKRWTQAGVTLNPAFFLKNIFRDGLAGAVQSNLGGANPFSGFVPGFTTKKGFQSRYMKDDHWFRWKASGAAHSAFVSLDRNYMRHNIRKLMASDRLHHRAGNVILHPLESLRILSELF